MQCDVERTKETEKETHQISSPQEKKTRKETPEVDGRHLVIATGRDCAIGPTLVLFTLDRLGGLDALERLSRPIVQGMLGLPDQAVQVFLKTMIRRENGAAELTVVNDHLNGLQLVVRLYVMTFVVPCVNAVIVLFKEQGAKICAALLLIVSSYALLAGTALNWGCQALGVTFR